MSVYGLLRDSAQGLRLAEFDEIVIRKSRFEPRRAGRVIHSGSNDRKARISFDPDLVSRSHAVLAEEVDALTNRLRQHVRN